MNRRLFALLPWMAVVGAAWGQSRSADVLYTFRESTPVRAFRVGDECFVPIDAADYWGWKAERKGNTAKVDAEGKTVSVPSRVVGGRECIALRKAVSLLGADSEWVATTDTLRVFAPLKKLSVSGGRVTATAPISVKASGYALSGPDRAVIDFEGARLSDDTKLELPKGARATQYRPNVVRLILEVPYVPVSPGMGGVTDREIALDIKPADLPEVKEEPQDFGPIPPITPPVRTTQRSTEPAPLSFVVSTDTGNKTVLQLPLQGRMQGPATFAKLDPSTLEITLPFVSGFVASDFISPTSAIVSAETVQKGFDTVLTLRLARPMGAEVSTSAQGVQIVLVKPTVGDGKLAGKVVIVDPGHGGHDGGAKSGGAREKDLTLSISKLLTEELVKAGATVIMTRKTDVFIPLGVRSDISNRNHADLYLSVHINSTGGSGSQSGTISFHHKGNEVGKLLAECIQAEMAKVNKLPNKGVWSDGRIYQSGFAVLRNTRQPAAVLLELGFINHPRDRARMQTQDFKTKIAAAIVKGVRNFLGDSAE
ncbi:N-acetylmuramoyl-L-alanine amidase [bacterium]|nr:MAG: N-acetylmuramoyl-L-alanine amidase [bacterium]